MMSSAIERRRAAKAARRKMVVAMKRKLATAEASLPLAQRARLLARRPMHCCLLQEGLFERGNGMLVLARLREEGDLAVAVFFVDAHCLGVKDVVFRRMELSELEMFVEESAELAPLLPVDPAYGRKLLREAVAYARSIGFVPHRDYAAAEGLFGDVSADACETAFRFGRAGKPLYVPGPGETAAQIDRRIDRLEQRLGAEGFDVMVPRDLVGAIVDSAVDAPASEELDAEPALAAR
jgi:hypothetical protein